MKRVGFKRNIFTFISIVLAILVFVLNYKPTLDAKLSGKKTKISETKTIIDIANTGTNTEVTNSSINENDSLIKSITTNNDTKTSNDSKTTSANKNKDSKTSDTKTSTPTPSTTTTPSTAPVQSTAPIPSTAPVTPTMHDTNQALINSIASTYGSSIGYGEGGYCYDGSYCAAATDENAVHDALLTIQQASATFPSGFFRAFQGVNGYRVYLYGNIPNEVHGVATYPYGDNVLYLNISSYSDTVYYHETFHIMEQYITCCGGDFANWSSYNTNNSTFEDTYDPNSAFLYEYSQTNFREDRATLFADLMVRGSWCTAGLSPKYMDNGTPINLKFKYLTSVINNYFPNNNARWNWCVKYQ